MSVQVSYKKQFTLGIILALILLAIVEAYAWNYDYTVSLCSVMEAKPYKNYDMRRQLCDDALSLRTHYDAATDWLIQVPEQHTKTININQENFRGPEITQEKPDDTFRIFVVGGSTVLGLRSTDERTISGYLQNMFDESNFPKRVEVINAGQNAFGSTQELLWIENKILKYDPDIVIVYDGANDIYNPVGFKYGTYPNATKPTLQVEFKNFHSQYFSFYKTIDMIYDIGQKATQRTSKWNFDDSQLETKISIWKENWIKMCTLSETKNFEIIMAIQPMLGTGNKKLTSEEKYLFERWNHEVVIPQYLQFFDELDDLKNHCSHVYDLSGVFDDHSEDIFFDGAHVGYQGNKIIAEELFKITYPVALEQNNIN